MRNKNRNIVVGSEVVVIALSSDRKRVITATKDKDFPTWRIELVDTSDDLYQHSFSELRDAGLSLEPEDLHTLWVKGEALTTEELQLIGEERNKNE